MEDVKTVVPTVPTYGVFYDLENDSIWTNPVLWYEWDVDMFKPVTFVRDGFYEAEEPGDGNFLALSLTPTPDKDDFKAEIEIFKAKQR